MEVICSTELMKRDSWRRGCRSTGEVEVCHGGRSISEMRSLWNSKAQGKQGRQAEGSSPRAWIVSDIEESVPQF